MYEPIILPKKKLRSLQGTPAAKYNFLINLMTVIIPAAGLSGLCVHIAKQNKFIADLGGYYDRSSKFEEFLAAKVLWGRTEFGSVMSELVRRELERDNSEKSHEN